MTSALKIHFNVVCYMNSRFIYFTFLLTYFINQTSVEASLP